MLSEPDEDVIILTSLTQDIQCEIVYSGGVSQLSDECILKKYSVNSPDPFKLHFTYILFQKFRKLCHASYKKTLKSTL